MDNSSSIIDRQALNELFTYFTEYNEIPPIRRNQPTSPYYPTISATQNKVNALFGKDYEVSMISNKAGDLCATYPLDLVIIQREKHAPVDSARVRNNTEELSDLFQKGRFARVRTRFPVPVIMYNNKNICRSATLSHKLECYLQKTYNEGISSQIMTSAVTGVSDSEMDRQRATDIALIKKLHVKYICDLMVENKKKKFGFEVCSSEKVDMHGRYSPFVIVPIPYPGIEFFREFHQNQHCADRLYFDWSAASDISPLAQYNVPISFADYSSWDLISLTKNYFKLILHFVAEAPVESGVLIHCISGWDRTPMMISLIRLSLWADGKIHQSLTPEEMLYLTVAYDWALFGHQLADRTSRGEDIFYFCFYFLEYISSPDFAIENIATVKPKDNVVLPSPRQERGSHLPLSSSSSTPSSVPHTVVHKHVEAVVSSQSKTIIQSEKSVTFGSSSTAQSAPMAIGSYRGTTTATATATAAVTVAHARRPSSEFDPLSSTPSSLEIGSWQFMNTAVSPPRLGGAASSSSSSSSVSPLPSPSPKNCVDVVPSHRHRKSSDASDTDITCGSWQMMLEVPESAGRVDKRSRRTEDDDDGDGVFPPSSWERDVLFPISDDVEALQLHTDVIHHNSASKASSDPTIYPPKDLSVPSGSSGSLGGHHRKASGGSLTTARALRLAAVKTLFMDLYKQHSTPPTPTTSQTNSTLWGWLPKLV